VDESGFIDAIIMEWPKAPGVDKAPIAIGPDAGMLFNTGDDPLRQEAAMELLRYINSTKVQKLLCKVNSRFASRLSVGDIYTDDPTWIITTAIIQKNGVFDTGVGLEKYAEVRNSWPPTLQAIFAGEMSVAGAVARFVTEGTAILEAE